MPPPYMDQMESHVKETWELVESGEKPYGGRETCRDHARVEAYDLIVLTAEAFEISEILDAMPLEIIDRFNRKANVSNL